MTTIQNRIIKDFRDKCVLPKHIGIPNIPEDTLIADINQLEQFLIQSIKLAQEETRKEVINHIDFFADQSRWFVDEDDGIGPIIQTRVIAVEDLQKELLSITNKEKQK